MHRRGLITGLVSLIAAPAIVRAGSLMPVVPVRETRAFFDPRSDTFTVVLPCGRDEALRFLAGQQWGHEAMARLMSGEPIPIKPLPINRLRVHST